MKSSGKQLEQITKLIEDRTIKIVVEKVYPFSQTNEALKSIPLPSEIHLCLARLSLIVGS